MWNAVALLPLLALRATAVPSVVELESLEWTVTNQNNSISVPAKFPSLTHLDLLAAGVIDDPLRNLNEFTLRWVAWQNWTYSAPVPQLSSSTGSTWLVFDGLDTFASITMCGKLVGNADNMFRQWFFDVSNVTSGCTTNSTLSINFGSAPIIAQAINNTQGTEHWPTSPIDPEDLFEIPFRQYVRKEQNDFGWDWSPAFASAGPWQPAQLVHLEPGDVFVRNTAVDVRKESQLPLEIPVQSEPWVINASMDILGTVSQGAKMNYRLLDSSNNSISSGALTEVNITSGSATGLVSIDDSSVDRWWPNGYGDQTLYFLEYSLVDSNETTLANVTKRIGFRTIMLNSFPVSDEELAQGWAAGNHFHFEVNGHELYMKGSNFVPPDPFWPRVTPDLIRMILESCKSANQNMIRVWSSGTYSPNFMHDIADELGLLLWSEFEFSVAMYPVAEDFLNSVREEVIYNTRRLSHHASLAFWAGGNELEKDVLPDLRTDQPSNFNHWIDEYEILFLNTIFPALFESQRSISYLPTGAGAGWIELNYSLPIPIVPRLYNTTPGEVYGDVDRYNYDTSQSFDITTYLVGRFANEFGFPSMPSTPSWQEQIDDEFLTFNSSVIVGRNRHYPPGGLGTTSFPNSMKGMGEYTLGVERWFPTPKKDNSLQNFTAWCHATQLFQASYIRNQIEFYRRGSGRPERQLGALYWQLNDIWIAPSWSSMTYDGRWKALHYLSKDIFQPVVIAPYFFFGNSSLEVYVISDLWSETAGTVNLTWYDWSGDPLNISSATVPFTIGAINTTRVLTLNVSAAVPDFSNAVLFMEQTSEGQLPNTNTTSTFTHENYFVPGISLVHAKLVDPGLEMSFSSDTQSFSVTATKGVAAFVWLEYPSGAIVQFDANGFWLRKGQTKEVGFTVVSDTTGGSWVNNVTVESVWDLTTP